MLSRVGEQCNVVRAYDAQKSPIRPHSQYVVRVVVVVASFAHGIVAEAGHGESLLASPTGSPAEAQRERLAVDHDLS